MTQEEVYMSVVEVLNVRYDVNELKRLGWSLHFIGGLKLMQRCYYTYKREYGADKVHSLRNLEREWDGVGDWMN